jgi:hypothetical protein
VTSNAVHRAHLTDTGIAAFLAARRKAIQAALAFAAMLIAGGVVPPSVALVVQGIIAALGVYGVHEVENDKNGTAGG